jgi:hypothetical protein
VEQAVFGVVDVNAGGDVHGVYEAQAFLHAAFADQLLNGVGDVEIIAPIRRFEPKMFGKGFHDPRMPLKKVHRNFFYWPLIFF